MPDARDLCTVDDVKALMQKSGANASSQDSLIQALITRASVKIMDDYAREFVPGGAYSVAFTAATRTFEFSRDMERVVFVDLSPYDLQTSPAPTVVIDSDLTSPITLTSDQWRLWPQPASQGVFSAIRLSLWSAHAAYPRFEQRQFTVTGNWGFPTVPAMVTQACAETVIHWITSYPAARRPDQVDSSGPPYSPRSYPMSAIDLLCTFKRPVV
jgi:hypothetical protein